MAKSPVSTFHSSRRWPGRAVFHWRAHVQKKQWNPVIPALTIFVLFVGAWILFTHSSEGFVANPTARVIHESLTAGAANKLNIDATPPLSFSPDSDDAPRGVVEVPRDYPASLFPLRAGSMLARLPERYQSDKWKPSAPALNAADALPPIRYAAGELLVRTAPGAIRRVASREILLDEADYAPNTNARDFFQILAEDSMTHSTPARIRAVKIPNGLTGAAREMTSNLYVLTLNEDTDILVLVRAFEAQRQVNPEAYSDILAIQPNYAYQPTLLPNDPRFTLEWGLNNTGQSAGVPDTDIDAPEAWDVTTGSPSVVIADIDTGVNYTHPDLAANMWHNPGEIPSNGIDDEGNGFIDDYYGWDFYSNDSNPMDFQGHGTHTSGTIAGVSNNNTGITGVCWNCKIMALKFFGPNGGFTDGAVSAFAYALQMGADITSNSWTGGSDDPLLRNAILASDAAGVLTVAAAGNLNGEIPMYPAYYPETLSVASIDRANEPSFFSNHNMHVDVAAPGSQVQSTIYPNSELAAYCPTDLDPTHYYTSCSGTSMATPHVAGIAGLLRSQNPALTTDQLSAILTSAVDPLNVSGVNPEWYFGRGRINAKHALDLAQNPPFGELDASNLEGVLSGTVPIHGSVGPGTYLLEYGAGFYPTTWISIASGTGPLSNAVLGSFPTVGLTDGTYALRLRVTNGGNTIHDQRFVSLDNLVITYPRSEYDNPEYFKTGTLFPIMGTAAAAGFQNYTVEWCAYPNTATACTLGPYTDGISLTDGGTHPIYAGRIGQFDTSQITNQLDAEKFWRILITVRVNASATLAENTTIIADPNLRWMKRISDDPDSMQYILPPNEPTVVDLDGDGKKEICALMKNNLTCLSAQGNMKPGFPVELPAFGDSFYDSYQPLPLTAADSGDGDALPELLFTSYRGDGTAGAPRIWVFAINGDGSTASGYPKKFHEPSVGSNGFGVFTGPTSIMAVQLIPGGPLEFVAQNFDALIPFDAQGVVLSGQSINLRPYDSDEFIQLDQPIGWPSALASGNFDDDPGMEIVAVHQYGFGNLPGGYGRVWVLNPDGSVLSGWPRTIETSTRASPVVADLDYDGKDEIIVGVFPSQWTAGATQGIYVFNARGELVPGFPWQEKTNGLAIPTQVLETPAIADLDNDGALEIIAASAYTSTGSGGALHVITQTGNEFPGWIAPFNVGQLNPRVVDTTTYPEKEIYDVGNVPAATEAIIGYSPQGASLASSFPKHAHRQTSASPVFDDLDGDGTLEMIAGANYPFSGFQSEPRPNSGSITVYDLSNPATGIRTQLLSDEWPMFQHDLQRTGRYARLTAPPAPTAAVQLAASVDRDPNRITITFRNSALAPTVKIYRSLTNAACPAGAVIQTLNFVPSSQLISVVQTTQDDGIQMGTNYYYSIGTANANGETCTPIAVVGRANPPAPGTEIDTAPGGTSSSVGGIFPSIGSGTDPPTEFTANDGTHGDRIRTTWTGVSGAQYQLYRAPSNNPGQAVRINPSPLPTTLYTDYAITPGQSYWYWATALLPSTGESPFSNGDSGYALGKPINVNASDGMYPDRIDVAWNSVNGASDYSLYRSPSNTACAGTPYANATGPSFSDMGLSGGSTYYYSIKAHAPPGYGLCSAVDSGSTSNSIGPGTDSGCSAGDIDRGDGTCVKTILEAPGADSGSVGQNGLSSWSGTIEMENGNNLNSSASVHTVLSYGDAGINQYAHTRAFERFSIPTLEGTALLAAELRFTPIAPAEAEYVSDGFATLNAVPASPSSPLDYSHYSALTRVSTQGYGRISLASITSTQPFSIPLNSLGRAAILNAAGGPFTIGLIEGHGIDGRPFAPESGVQNQVRYAGSTSLTPPALVLTYAPTP